MVKEAIKSVAETPPIHTGWQPHYVVKKNQPEPSWTLQGLQGLRQSFKNTVGFPLCAQSTKTLRIYI